MVGGRAKARRWIRVDPGAIYLLGGSGGGKWWSIMTVFSSGTSVGGVPFDGI